MTSPVLPFLIHLFALQLFPVSVGLLKPRSVPPAVVSNALLCVGELCSSLKAHAIAHLSTIMPPLLKILRDKPLLDE